MNEQLSVKKYVEWKILIPDNNASPLTSPDFLIWGSEWYFELRFEMYSAEIYYNIYLCKRSETGSLEGECLEKTLSIITFIKKDNYYDLSDRYSQNVNYSDRRIARYPASRISSHLQRVVEQGEEKWLLEVFCILKLPASDIMEKIDPTKDIQAHFTDLESLSLDLSNQLNNEASQSDVVVRCGDCTSRAHRVVLAARSDVFSAMFRNKMVESETGVVEITDMDEADFELFLKFVYSGKIEIPSEDSATSLYAASDKYAILSLKKACSDYLVKNLNPENCLRFLEMSERHGDEPFTGAVLNFVAENLDGLDREEWSSFSEEFPKLMVKVYEKRLKGTLSKQVSFKKVKCLT